MASDPTGGVLMFGGESTTASGELRNDTLTFSNPSNAAIWTRLFPTGSPTRRTEHALAAGTSTDDTAIFILFGGLAEPMGGGSPVPSDQTFVYSGGWGTTGVGQTAPSARTGHSMVTDLIRNRVVLFGGLSGGVRKNDLWEFDPVNLVWLQPTITGPLPPTRFDHASAFHEGNGMNEGRIYVAGGAPFRDDMWEFNPWNATWTNVTAATRPPARRRAAMSYLPAFDQLVLYGGESSSLQPLDDTWTWDRTGNMWTQRSGTPPPARFDHAMAPDQLGNNLVVFGGDDRSGTVLKSTWLWNGSNWSERNPPPLPRSDVALAYDRARERLVLFGGRESNQNLRRDTWELDGFTWRDRSQATAPAGRADAGIAFDHNRQRTVVFGGRSTSGNCGNELADTWEWDGQSWNQIAVAASPPAAGGIRLVFDSERNVCWALVGSSMWSFDGVGWTESNLITPRFNFAAAYDSMRNRLVVFGGHSPQTQENGDTWEWDGTGWLRGNPTNAPPARRSSRMTYHAAQQACILSCGYADPNRLGDSWAWDGSNWTQAANLPFRADHSSSYDHGRGRTIVFGGLNAATSSLNDHYEWDGATWQALSGSQPSARWLPAMAYDPVRDRTVMFGGQAFAVVPSQKSLDDTHEFDGAQWVQRTPSTSPPVRAGAGMSYDPHTGGALLFGGYNAAGARLNDTWCFDGSNWLQRTPMVSPADRSEPYLFTTGSRTLLFGGAAPSRIFGDLWEWDGSEWMLIDSGAPPWRTNYGAAYDARRDRVVVFGGMTDCDPVQATFLNDTWEWDGDSWLERFPAPPPSPRAFVRTAYDEGRARTVMFGGTNGAVSFNQTYEWDGAVWLSRAPSGTFVSDDSGALTYDSKLNRVISFGFGDTWSYGPVVPAQVEFFGVGCVGSSGLPSLQPQPWAGPWLGESMEIDLVDPPPGLGLFVWGFSNAVWAGGALPFSLAPLGAGVGCNLLVSDAATQLFLSGTTTYTSFVWPNDPSFLGTVMYGQAGFLDVGLGGAPVVTHGLRVTVGSK